MTSDEAIAAVGKLSLCGLLEKCGITVYAVKPPPGPWRPDGEILIAIKCDVPDRDDWTKLAPLWMKTHTIVYNMDEPQLMAYLRHLIHQFMRHEVDECLLVDGVRVWDPHK